MKQFLNYNVFAYLFAILLCSSFFLELQASEKEGTIQFAQTQHTNECDGSKDIDDDGDGEEG